VDDSFDPLDAVTGSKTHASRAISVAADLDCWL
jgi:hypothetical protein